MWVGVNPPSFIDLIRGRYREYSGPHPLPASVKNDVLGPTFDSTVLANRWTFPGIKLDNMKDDIGKTIAGGFVGWHYTNARAFGRTVFALACGTFYNRIKDHFTQTVHNEPLGVFVGEQTDRSGPHTDFVRRVFVTQTKTRPDNLLVEPGIVTIKGPGSTALATQCQTTEILVKTEFFRLMEGEVWHILAHMIRQTRKLPQKAVRGCLGSRLLGGSRVMTMKQLIDIRPSATDALARLIVAVAQIYVERRIRPTEYRQIQLMNEGTLVLYKRLV